MKYPTDWNFLDGIHNLTIQGAEDGQSEIVVEPRYANVINFLNCSNISISNIKAGHTEGSVCSGGVFLFHNCVGIQIDNTHMYGCGTRGLSLYKTADVTVTGSTIYECTSGMMNIQSATNIMFQDCVFRDNITAVSNSMINAMYVSGLTFDACSFLRNTNGEVMFTLTGCENIVVSNTEFFDNEVREFSDQGDLEVDASSRFEDNKFDTTLWYML